MRQRNPTKAAHVLDLLLEFFADGEHWTVCAMNDGHGWLKEQALRHFPRAEFRAGSADADDREAILDHLCVSRIARSISWIWDGGVYATIGELKRAEKYFAASAGEAIDWLRDQAILHHPGSEFAHQYAGFGA
jgi:hypothetical protein